MSGRYDGELFVRFPGSREAAAAYMPAARALMGEALELAGFNNLGSYKLTRELRDGTVIVAEKIGDLNRVTIEPPQLPGGRRPIRTFDDLIITAGADEWNSGGERVRPPVLASQGEEGGWASYFAGSAAPGYQTAVATGIRCGTYAQAFPEVMRNDKRLFGGNRIWRGAAGEVVSWAAAFDVIAPPFRNPNSLYGSAVYYLGRIAYASGGALTAASYPHVLAAALKDGRLLVLCAALGGIWFTPRPAVAAQMHDAWASPAYSAEAQPMALYSIGLKTRTDELSGQLYFEANYDDEEQLWSGSLAGGYNRWSFNQDATECVSVQLPEQPILLYKAGVLDAPITSTTLLYRVSTAGGLTTEPADDVVMEDDGRQLKLEKVAVDTYDYVAGDRRIPALRRTGASLEYTAVLHADMVNDCYVLEQSGFTYDGAWLTASRSSSVIDHGSGAALGDPQPPATTFAGEHYGAAIATVMADLDASGATGVSLACHAICGVPLSAVDPGDGEDEPAVAMIRAAMMVALSINRSMYGVGTGALSLSSHNDEDATNWAWDTNQFFGNGDSTSPQYTESVSVIFTRGSAVSTARYLAAYGNGALYLTDADLPQLTGGAFTDQAFYSLLGRPPLAQPKDSAA